MKKTAGNQQRRVWGAVLAATLALSAAGASAAPRESAAAEPEKITVGVVVKVSIMWPLYVAEEKGFFRKRGLTADIVSTGGSAKGVQQLAAGALQIDEGGLPDLIRAIQGGAPAKIVVLEMKAAPYRVFAQKQIKSVPQLKGKKIMIGGSKDVTRIYVEAMLKAHGLKASDYDYFYAGSSANRFAALQSGGVDATILPPPFDFQSEALGFTDLGTTQSYLKDFPFDAYAVNTNWAKERRQTAVGFVAGFLEGARWLYNEANKGEAVAILTKFTETNRDIGNMTYDLFMKKIDAFSRDGKLSRQGYERLMEALVELGDMEKPIPPMERFFDYSYIDASAR